MRKLFVLGVDGATLDVLKPWIDEGHLPGFQGLLGEGGHAVLKSSIPFLSPVAWTSIATGVNPGKHGIYDFLLKKHIDEAKTHVFTFATGGDRKTKAFWEILSQHGKRCIIANMPCSYPPDPINGIMISGWDAAREPSKGFYPREIYNEIIEKFGGYYMVPLDLISKSELAGDDPKSEEKLKDALLKMAELRREVFLYLARKYPWDIFFGVFYETDTAQHRFWKERHDPDNPILRVYKEIDRFILELVTEFGEEIDIMAVSDHGFSDLISGVDLNFYLEQLGLLKRDLSVSKSLVFKMLQKMPNLRRLLKSFSGKRWMPERFETLKPRHMTIDFEKSRIFFEGMYPFFNVLGDEDPQQLYEILKKGILSLEHNGTAVFKDVLSREEVFWGPYVHEIPEFIGIMDERFEVSGAEVFMGNGMFHREVFCDHIWAGNHTENGTFIFRGKNMDTERLPDASVMDIAPTILVHQGLAVPSEMDGKPIKEVIRGQDIRFSDETIYKDQNIHGSWKKKEDMDLLKDRLESLGYL